MRALFPNASQSFLNANALILDAHPKTYRGPQSSKSEPAVRNEPLAAAQGAPFYSGRCLVRVTSYRCGQQCDPDNLGAKYFIDALRYAGVLRDDRPEDIDYQAKGVRVSTRKEERTEIEVIPL